VAYGLWMAQAVCSLSCVCGASSVSYSVSSSRASRWAVYYVCRRRMLSISISLAAAPILSHTRQ